MRFLIGGSDSLGQSPIWKLDLTAKYPPRRSRNQIGKKIFSTKDSKITKFGVLIIRTLRVLRITIVESLRSSRKFSRHPARHTGGITRAKTQRRQVRKGKIIILTNELHHSSPTFAALASLREIFRVSVASMSRWAFVVSRSNRRAATSRIL